MKWISYGGCLDGLTTRMFSRSLIQEALLKGYDVLIHVWIVGGKVYFGKVIPEEEFDLDFVNEYRHQLWLGCGNDIAYNYFHNYGFRVFWNGPDPVHWVQGGYRLIENLRFAYGVQQEIVMIDRLAQLRIPLVKYGGVCSPNIQNIYQQCNPESQKQDSSTDSNDGFFDKWMSF